MQMVLQFILFHHPGALRRVNARRFAGKHPPAKWETYCTAEWDIYWTVEWGTPTQYQ